MLENDPRFINTQVTPSQEDPWFLRAINGSPREARRKEGCDFILNIAQLVTGSWLVLGDFNAIFPLLNSVVVLPGTEPNA